jgi:hypothetical protein
MGAGGLRVTPSVGATCGAGGQRRPAAMLQSALQAADAVSERGGGEFEIVV